MVQTFSRRVFLGGLLSSAAGGALANAPTISLRPVLRSANGAGGGASVLQQPVLQPSGADAIVKAAGLSGEVSFAVADAKSGTMVESYKDATVLPPASVTKAITALYAIETLGPSHRFQTRLTSSAPLENGILKGDLVLVGGGDPTLDTDAMAELARRLKAAGVREVRGQFRVYGGALPYVRTIDPGQPDSVGYSPAVSGLGLNYNRVHFEWKRGANGWVTTMDARSEKYRPEVSFAKIKVASRDFPVYTYKKMGTEDHWTVAGAALGEGGARWLPVRQPEIYAGEVLRTFARSQGIVLKAPKVSKAAPKGRELVTFQSPELRVILKAMLKYSNNLTAEMVGMATSRARGAAIHDLKSSGRAMSNWAGQVLGMKRAALVDHSGLGGESRLSAAEMTQALTRARQRAELAPLLKEITLRHKDGSPNKKHPLKVLAKTGTLNFVSALAGYIQTPDGRELAFAILVADTKTRSKIKKNDRVRPQGARSWNRKAKRLQQALIERWGGLGG